MHNMCATHRVQGTNTERINAGSLDGFQQLQADQRMKARLKFFRGAAIPD